MSIEKGYCVSDIPKVESIPPARDYNLILPEQKYLDKNKEQNPLNIDAVIHWAGTFEDPWSTSMIDFKKSIANFTGAPCYIFYASEDPRKVQALIKEKEFENILITTYSQGSLPGAELAILLENDQTEAKKVNIEAVVVMAPVGIYTQKYLKEIYEDVGVEGVMNFIFKYRKERKKELKNIFKKYDQANEKLADEDTRKMTDQELRGKYKEMKKKQRKNDWKESWKVGKAYLNEIARYYAFKKIGILNEGELPLDEQIKKMGPASEAFGKIKSPVVVVQDSIDKVSDIRKTVKKEVGLNSLGEIAEIKKTMPVFKSSQNVTHITIDNRGHGFPGFEGVKVAAKIINVLRKNNQEIE